jgi:menaquinol-cytochrome c reductase iron-sulfur subunit
MRSHPELGGSGMTERVTDTTASPPEHPSRRSFFFRWATYGLGGLASAVVGLPLVGYLLGQKKPAEHWVGLGRSEDFEAGATRLVTFENPIRQPWDGLAAMTGVYVRRQAPGDGDEGRFLIFAVNCAHLGCPVEWFPQSGLFMCPCHGGVYHANGDRASGPPPRALYQCVWRERDGELQVRAPHYPTLQDTEKAHV